MTLTIACLGNPGEEYAKTRHNTGRIVGDFLHTAWGGSEWKTDKKLNALTAKATVGKHTVQFVYPETFMNKSGAAVKPLITSVKKAEQLVVVYDDLDLGIGSMKLSFNRGSGGHRGLESIAKAIKTEKFMRVRVGISPVTAGGKTKKLLGPEKVEKHILGAFKADELGAIKKLSQRIADGLESLMNDGREKAMSVYNAG